MVELSVVVPVFKCEECLKALHARLTAAASKVTDDYELIFVDDRSPDSSWEVMEGLAATDPKLRLIRLSRNFGQHPAITTGLAHSSGRWVVVTDCDLEDPPEEIPRLYATAQEGFDAVLCRRKVRRQSIFRRVSARLYRRLTNFLAQAEVDPDFTNLSILNRKVVDAFLSLRDLDRQYLLIVLWLGFEHTTIEVDQDERHAGESSYTVRELIRVAADGMFFQTANLLRWIIYSGFAIAVLGMLTAGGLIVYSYSLGNPPPGWASLGVLVMLLSGVIVISTGVTGLYVGKVFGQVKGRPLYVVDTDFGDAKGSRAIEESTERPLPSDGPEVPESRIGSGSPGSRIRT